MKYKLVILRPVTLTNDYGEETTSYEEVRTIHAERVKYTGNKSDEVSEHFADYRAEFNVRSQHPVSEQWRVRQLGGHTFTVVAVIPNLDRGMNTLICERLNQ